MRKRTPSRSRESKRDREGDTRVIWCVRCPLCLYIVYLFALWTIFISVSFHLNDENGKRNTSIRSFSCDSKTTSVVVEKFRIEEEYVAGRFGVVARWQQANPFGVRLTGFLRNLCCLVVLYLPPACTAYNYVLLPRRSRLRFDNCVLARRLLTVCNL